ncbi:hypothetical protein GCM10023084_28570 [Streptomyces lacrimifluminis]|uniref:SnoaL-like domain-containing protein n=1 Tax=Streptomyces lacrimifluminis TaxID=1500077 RepID=A0A917KW19_9ACTN|nr:nuclear transport factor 2 family protein [Streptomyces lacrimifluminis]GGJ27612.1 hypothetical protein GCM10012282_25190 [Streptomyces lacrimifluminis]
MNDFSIVGGVAEIHTPDLYRTWMDRPDYIDAVAASPDPGTEAVKRLVIEFEAELARLVRDRTVDKHVREVMEKYTVDDYVQHDPNAPGNGRELLIEFFRHVPLDRGTPPPVVSVTVEGELACVMMREPAPDPVIPGATYDWNILTLFRVRNGRLTEHWSAYPKRVPGEGPM